MYGLQEYACSALRSYRSGTLICIGLVVILTALRSHSLRAQPFYCTGELILATSPDADSSRFYRIESDKSGNGEIIFEEFSDTPEVYLNALGYSIRDHYVYAISPKTRNLCRLDAKGEVLVLEHLEELDENKSYNAGAMTSDGRYLIALSARTTIPPYENVEILRIDLLSDGYPAEVFTLRTMSGNDVSTRDVAFHPEDGVLYGYDGIYGRLIEISLSSFEVDDISYPATGNIDLMAAMFFDAWGNLYGYGRETGQLGIRSLLRIDTETGNIEEIGSGPLATGSDGCSCPSRIEFTKSVYPTVTTPCSQVVYKFEVVNASGATQSQVRFVDQLPQGFKVVELLGNPYQGTVNGLNSGMLTLADMTIPPGIDSFEIVVEIGDVPPGLYKNQAALRGLLHTLGGFDLSDDPGTSALNDSTTLIVEPGPADEQLDSLLFICPGDTLLLDASFLPGVHSFSWNTGEVSTIKRVSDAGTYDVIATNDCHTIQVTFDVRLSSDDFSLDLGPDRFIKLGDRIELIPDLAGADAPAVYWYQSSALELSCAECQDQTFYPPDNSTYYLTVTDINGCEFLDSLNVFVEKNYTVFVPNVFSPNQDGINDILYLHSDPIAIVEEFSVYDRWGNTVFISDDHQTGDISVGWNGTLGDEYVQAGVFVWKARLRYFDGAVRQYSGNVTVLR